MWAHGILHTYYFFLNFGENSLTKKLAKADFQLSLVEVGLVPVGDVRVSTNCGLSSTLVLTLNLTLYMESKSGYGKSKTKNWFS